jgi:adhesin transport system outer membrane protein
VELAEPGLLDRPGNDLEEVISETLKIHPALKVAKFNEDASLHDYQRAKSKYFPTLDLQFQSIAGDDTDAGSGRVEKQSIVLSLNMNLYNGRSDMAEKSKKASIIYENKAYFDLVKRQVMDRLRLAWVADLGIQKELYYLDQHLRRAKKTAKLYRDEFYIGQRDLLDLLDAENELNTAEIKLTESRYDGYLAVYRIHEGVGKLLEPLGLKVLLSGDNLTIEKVRVENNQSDVIPYPIDLDKDVVRDNFDHCDNSLAYEDVNRYGCRKRISINYGYKKPEAPKIEHINFKFDSVELTAESARKVDDILLQMDKYPLAEIEFYAHTDELGNKEYNEELSERRARGILQLLIDRGVDGRRIKAVGMGEDNPIADNATRTGQAKNRRGEFRIILY